MSGEPAPGAAPFVIDVPGEVLKDLRWRLERARWPNALLVAGTEDAGRLNAVWRLLEGWRSTFDWRQHERRVNALPQYRIVVDGIGLHVVWARSKVPGARPLLLLNGWPSSFLEYERVIAALTTPADGLAFDVVIPTRPGYGFSDAALDRGAVDDDDVADLFTRLMHDHLGYDRFLAHGDDFGGSIASRIAWRHPGSVAAIHLAEWLDPYCDAESTTADERRYLDALADWRERERAYGALAATRPQTLGFALGDSPLGLLAWVTDKFLSWTDARADGELAIPEDFLLATTTLYWVTESMTTAMRPYAEGPAPLGRGDQIMVPTGVVAPHEGRPPPPRRWIERAYGDLRSYRVRDRGGHFLAAECPDSFVAELRAFFGAVDVVSGG
jgi:pimeloyl-ACP methyl ester carboxylesterase